MDGRLRPGDELLFVDRIPVVGKPHRYVIDLMHAAARNGQVNLVIRRRAQTGGKETCMELILGTSLLNLVQQNVLQYKMLFDLFFFSIVFFYFNGSEMRFKPEI